MPAIDKYVPLSENVDFLHIRKFPMFSFCLFAKESKKNIEDFIFILASALGPGFLWQLIMSNSDCHELCLSSVSTTPLRFPWLEVLLELHVTWIRPICYTPESIKSSFWSILATVVHFHSVWVTGGWGVVRHLSSCNIIHMSVNKLLGPYWLVNTSRFFRQ